ncbi:Ras-related protein Rap-1A [Sarotherodon galilaeus]
MHSSLSEGVVAAQGKHHLATTVETPIRETASPDRLWSGVGFRLDDRVYKEDRVTKFLRQQQQQAFPRCTLSGIDSLHS